MTGAATGLLPPSLHASAAAAAATAAAAAVTPEDLGAAAAAALLTEGGAGRLHRHCEPAARPDPHGSGARGRLAPAHRAAGRRGRGDAAAAARVLWGDVQASAPRCTTRGHRRDAACARRCAAADGSDGEGAGS